MTDDIRILVVGGGIASVHVVMTLMQHTKNITFYSHSISSPHNSSLKAGASIVPIKMTKKGISRIDDSIFLKIINSYTALEKRLGQSFLYKKPLKIFNSDDNNPEINCANFQIIDDAYFLNIRALLQSAHHFFRDNLTVIYELFDSQQLITKDDKVEYLGAYYDKVIFCEGVFMRENPFFSKLELTDNWGLALRLKIKNLDHDTIYHYKKRLLPIEENEWWYGAEHIWEEPSKEYVSRWADAELNNLKQSIGHSNINILEIICQQRPTTPGQFPYIGRHPNYPQLFVMNGLGSKGMQISARYVDAFVDYILGKTNDMVDYDNKKFQSLFYK